jgi:tetratricopeptide (TPR) repeat protein
MKNMIMKRFLIIALLQLCLLSSGFSQTLIKNASDTSFLLDRVYFPQLQIKLSISFVTSDFSVAPKKRISFSDIEANKKLIRGDPKNGDHYISLAEAYNEFNKTRKADSVKQVAKDIFVNNLIANAADTHAVRTLANIYLGEMQWDLARSFFQELTRTAPGSSAGWCGLALISMASYDFNEALKNMQKAIDAEPGNIDNYCQMANIIMMKSVIDLDSYDSLKMDTLTYRGIIDTKFIRDALKKKPGDPSLSAIQDALTLSGIIYETFIDNSESFTGKNDTVHFKVSPDCEKALSEIEKRMTTRIAGTFADREFPYTCLMLTEFLRNDPDKALTWFNKGVKYNPRSQSLYENMTGISAMNGRKDAAYKLQLRLDSIHPSADNFLMTGYFYYLDKNYYASQNWTEKVLAVEPTNFDAMMGMAALCIKQMKLSGAALFLDQAAGMDQEHPDVTLLTGIMYLLDNSPVLAKASFQELIKSGQNRIEAQQLIDRFLK